MKKFLTSLLILCIILSAAIVVYAASDSWSYSDYSKGSYVSKSGTMTSSYTNGYAVTKVEFKLDSNNVASITEYNNGNNSSYPNVKGYLTIDVTSVKNGNSDAMDAYAITSNLPDPKFDMENDDWFDSRNEESETVALGQVVSNKKYYMTTKWEDLRNGNSGDSGRWQCQFSMSKKGWSDYNTFVQSSEVQATINYGTNAGQD